MQASNTKTSNTGATRHYAVLDGMRGLAAIAVVMSHAGESFFGHNLPGSGYLAVDLFFVLSGFVIAHAYGRKLSGSLSPRRFMFARVLRLFPLYLTGVAITVLAVVAAVILTRDAGTWSILGLEVAGLLALFMLPSPIGIPGTFFPLNFPTWSLFYEMLVNVVYAICRGRFGGLAWTCVIVCAAGGVVVQSILFAGVDQGALWSTTAWALARVFYSFPVGVLLYRHHHRLTTPASLAPVLCAVLVALLWLNPTGVYRSAYDAVFVLAASPAIVLLGAASAPARGTLDAAYRALGVISYPIYVLHDPIIAVVKGLSRRVHGLDIAALAPWSGIGLLIALLVLSWAAARGDAAVRGWLASGLSRRAHLPGKAA